MISPPPAHHSKRLSSRRDSVRPYCAILIGGRTAQDAYDRFVRLWSATGAWTATPQTSRTAMRPDFRVMVDDGFAIPAHRAARRRKSGALRWAGGRSCERQNRRHHECRLSLLASDGARTCPPGTPPPWLSSSLYTIVYWV